MKTRNTLILLSAIIFSSNVFGQFANVPPVGPSTNLCPGQLYRYTSPPTPEGGKCDIVAGWGIEFGEIVNNGVNTNNSVWADVRWGNFTSGRLGNSCGVLSVTINGIPQPSIVGPGTVLLCGTSSLVIQATASPTTNITGYVWQISGTGVSPTGLVNTTAPQITINYSNWVAESNLSATVAVGTKNSCGFTTDTTPLVSNQFISAIPRTAWVQLSLGNVNALQAPLNFSVLLPDGSPSASIICSTGTMSVTNQPLGSNLAWSSSNTSQLSINSNSGALTRQNNYNGSVVVTASLTNACGSVDQTTNIWLGIPSSPGSISGNTSPSVGGIYTYLSTPPSNGATSYNWTLPFAGNPLWSQYNGNINGVINTLAPSLIVGSSSGWLQAFGVNVCGNSSPSRLRIFPVSGGGGGQQQRIAFPNPANDKIKVKVKEEDTDEEVQIVLMNKTLEKVLSTVTKEKEVDLSVSNVPDGIYYLNITVGKEKVQRQIVIKH